MRLAALLTLHTVNLVLGPDRSRRMLRRSIPCLALLLAAVATADPLRDLDPVGSTTLKVFFWTIYDSTLFSSDGVYRGMEPGLSLLVTYRRRISRTDLIDRTREEWQKLDIYKPGSEQWLNSLAAIWPDVEKGDQLLLQVNNSLGSSFYFNGVPVGDIQDSQFTSAFLAIWLSEQSSYPKQRNQLVGQGS